MNTILWYLTEPFAQHALLAATVVAILCGLIGPFVVMRNMAFAVHGTSELAFTGAAGGLLLGGGPLIGSFVGAILVATFIGVLGVKERERDSTIGVILAFGLGIGILLLSFYHGFATQATNILFGNIFGVSGGQLWLLVGIGVLAMGAMAIMYRPLLFASLDPEVARAKGVPIRAVSLLFLLVLAITVTEAAQIVGTLLVLSLAISPAAAATRISANPRIITLVSVGFALVASVGGLLLSFVFDTVKPSVFISLISFSIYIIVRIASARRASAKTTTK